MLGHSERCLVLNSYILLGVFWFCIIHCWCSTDPSRIHRCKRWVWGVYRQEPTLKGLLPVLSVHFTGLHSILIFKVMSIVRKEMNSEAVFHLDDYFRDASSPLPCTVLMLVLTRCLAVITLTQPGLDFKAQWPNASTFVLHILYILLHQQLC